MEDSDFEIINAQKEVCREHDAFLMLTEITEKIIYDQKYMNPEAFGHYSLEGQKLLGDVSAKTLAKYIKSL